MGTSAAAGFVGGSVTANICLFDESYNYFNQAETLSLSYVGFSLVPLINECYDVTINSVGFALDPVRRYYQFSATLASNGWFTRDGRFGIAYNTNIWTYINNAVITDLNVAVGQPFPLVLSSGAGTVSAPNPALSVQYTE